MLFLFLSGVVLCVCPEQSVRIVGVCKVGGTGTWLLH